MNFISRFFSLWLLLLLAAAPLHAQEGTVRGKVVDPLNKAIRDVKVTSKVTGQFTNTDAEGQFSLRLPEGKDTIIFSHLNYVEAREVVTIRPASVENLLVKMLEGGTTIGEVVIHGGNDLQNPNFPFMEVVPVLPEMASVMGGIEQNLAATAAGVSMNNELSSQYRVRGGNYDENLVYVNGIEIYRPFLVRSGQQEGLSFINPALVDEVGFSSGGFQARYGDKLSSVLDITYNQPKKFGGSVQAGILTNAVHFEGVITPNKKALQVEEAWRKYNPAKFTFLIGGRRFTPSYVLGSLDTKGNYQPTFHDAQGMFTFVPKQENRSYNVRTRRDGSLDTVYCPKERVKLTFFTHFANNNYYFAPEARETSFGTVQNVLRLRVGFLGQESSYYQTWTNAVMLENRPNVRLRLRHIASLFTTIEGEFFDVEGGYFLSDVNSNFGSEGYNEVTFDRGIGTFLRHARNQLFAAVAAVEQKGDYILTRDLRHRLSWGLRFQYQQIVDELNEWNGVDSAGYFTLQESFRSDLSYDSYLVKAYVQDYWKLSKDETKRLVVGTRVIYNSLNGQVMLAPRVQFVIDPSSGKDVGGDEMETGDLSRTLNRKYQLRFAAGVYHQPTFYREMRALDGAVNLTRRAQVSYHFIAGGDYLFKVWGRDFRLFGEAYFKYLDGLVPYETENVRIRYYPFNNAHGFAYGIDARITGQFIKGLDSWFNLGLLRTKEDLLEDGEGWVSRPSDQRINFGMYFQDELPVNPTYKVHINFVYGSGLRFGPPRVIENRTVFTTPSYQRVDLGFSKIWVFHRSTEFKNGIKHEKGLESLWISFEVFNLFQRSNTVSYTWVKDVFNAQFAVPNYLSARLLNIRATMKF